MSLDDSESVALKMESPPSPTEPLTALSALRTIRIARGLSIQDVAARLKFAPRMIEAFEAEQWDQLPSGIGLKTLAKNYAKFLDVDFAALEPALRDHLDSMQQKTGLAEHTSTKSLGEAVETTAVSGSIGWIVLIVIVVIVVLGIAVWQGIVPPSMLPDWLERA
jgi:cytoskeletal protein RodZ